MEVDVQDFSFLAQDSEFQENSTEDRVHILINESKSQDSPKHLEPLHSFLPSQNVHLRTDIIEEAHFNEMVS